MTYRAPRSGQQEMAGTSARMLRGLLSVRALLVDTFAAVERVVVRGRASADPNAYEDGEHDEYEAEHCQPIGLVARPATDAEVAVVVGNVGGDGTNPHILGAVDGTRALVIDARGIAADVTIMYNSTDVLEIRDGKIRAGSLGGVTQPLPTKADFDALVAWASGHRHDQAGAAPGPTSIPTNTPPLTPVGAPDPAPACTCTTRFEAE